MWWKIYFWIYTVLSVIGLFALIGYSPLGFGDLLGFISSIVLIIGIYAYVFRKSVFSADIWKVIFWYHAVAFTISVLDLYFLPGFIKQYLAFLESKVSFSGGSVLFSIIFSLPAVYAIYKLGYVKKIIGSKKKSK